MKKNFLLNCICRTARITKGIIDGRRNFTNIIKSFNSQIKSNYNITASSSLKTVITAIIDYFDEQSLQNYLTYAGKGQKKIMIPKNQVSSERISFGLNLSNYSERAAEKIKLHCNHFKEKRLQLNFNVYAKSGIPLEEALLYEAQAKEIIFRNGVHIDTTVSQFSATHTAVVKALKIQTKK
jgi:hypothetical protein